MNHFQQIYPLFLGFFGGFSAVLFNGFQLQEFGKQLEQNRTETQLNKATVDDLIKKLDNLQTEARSPLRIEGVADTTKPMDPVSFSWELVLMNFAIFLACLGIQKGLGVLYKIMKDYINEAPKSLRVHKFLYTFFEGDVAKDCFEEIVSVCEEQGAHLKKTNTLTKGALIFVFISLGTGTNEEVLKQKISSFLSKKKSRIVFVVLSFPNSENNQFLDTLCNELVLKGNLGRNEENNLKSYKLLEKDKKSIIDSVRCMIELQ